MTDLHRAMLQTLGGSRFLLRTKEGAERYSELARLDHAKHTIRAGDGGRLFTKSVRVSDCAIAMGAELRSELSYQIAKRIKELKRDISWCAPDDLVEVIWRQPMTYVAMDCSDGSSAKGRLECRVEFVRPNAAAGAAVAKAISAL